MVNHGAIYEEGFYYGINKVEPRVYSSLYYKIIEFFFLYYEGNDDDGKINNGKDGSIL